MPIEIVRKYLAQIAEAFSFMADKKIVHRDFKLDNLCLSQAKGDCRLLDLGFAREYRPVEAGESNLTLQTPRGHLRYRSPENNGVEKVDHKDDMWALGLVLCEMISGKTTEDIMGEHVWAKFVPIFEDKLNTWIQSVVAIDKDLGGIAQGLLQTLPGERLAPSRCWPSWSMLIRNRIITKHPPPFLAVGWLESLLHVQVPSDLEAALEGRTIKRTSYTHFCTNSFLLFCFQARLPSFNVYTSCHAANST